MKQNLITSYFNILFNNLQNNSHTILLNTLHNNNNNNNNNNKNNKNNKNIIIYTDGACSNNGKKNAKAGIGIYIENMYDISEKLLGKQTNQRAELYAILKALQIININNYHNIIIYTDSQYSINCITKWIKNWIRNNWLDQKNKPVKNKDLIESIYNICKTNSHIIFKHVLAHTNATDNHSIGNSKADMLARKAIK